MDNSTYNDKNLQQLFAEMDPKRRLQAIKGGFRKEANRVRKLAISNLRGSIKSNRNIEKGVRAIVFKRKAGFRVTVGTKRSAKKKPQSAAAKYWAKRKQGQEDLDLLLIWNEDGTKDRKTKTKTRVWTRLRKGHSTGRIKRHGFMEKTLNATRDSVTTNIHAMVAENVQKVAEKYGCK